MQDTPALTVSDEQALLRYPDGRTGCPDYVMEDSIPPRPYWPPLYNRNKKLLRRDSWYTNLNSARRVTEIVYPCLPAGMGPFGPPLRVSFCEVTPDDIEVYQIDTEEEGGSWGSWKPVAEAYGTDREHSGESTTREMKNWLSRKEHAEYSRHACDMVVNAAYRLSQDRDVGTRWYQGSQDRIVYTRGIMGNYAMAAQHIKLEGPDTYIVDSGSAFDFISGEKAGAGHEEVAVTIPRPLTLLAADGEMKCDRYVPIYISILDETAKPLLLPRSPAVLSLGKRCVKHGYSFWWPPYSVSPQLMLPGSTATLQVGKGSRVVDLRVQQYVPMLDVRAPTQYACPAPVSPRTSAGGALILDGAVRPAGGASASSASRPEPLGADPDTDDEGVQPPPSTPDVVRPKRAKGEALAAEIARASSFEHLLTHKPKCSQCAACELSKMQRTPRRSGTAKLEDVTGRFGDLITADTLVASSDKNLGLLGAETALICFDRCTHFLDGFPRRSKSAADHASGFRDFLGKAVIVRYYGDFSPEIKEALSQVGHEHPDGAQPGIPASNGFIERQVRSVTEGVRTVLEQSGLPIAMWPWALRCWCLLNNLEKKELYRPDGLQCMMSPWEARHGEKFTGTVIPFGSLVYYMPVVTNLKNEPKFATRAFPGIFLGYYLWQGARWSGQYYVADLRCFACSADNKIRLTKVRIQRTSECKRPPGDKVIFPLKQVQERERFSFGFVSGTPIDIYEAVPKHMHTRADADPALHPDTEEEEVGPAPMPRDVSSGSRGVDRPHDGGIDPVDQEVDTGWGRGLVDPSRTGAIDVEAREPEGSPYDVSDEILDPGGPEPKRKAKAKAAADKKPKPPPKPPNPANIARGMRMREGRQLQRQADDTVRTAAITRLAEQDAADGAAMAAAAFLQEQAAPARTIIEYCCGPHSLLGEYSRPGCTVVRLTEEDDLTTKRGLAVAYAAAKSPNPLLWCAIPCTGGSSLQNLNKGKKNFKANMRKHRMKFRRLWENFVAVAKAVHASGGRIAIEWPTGCSYWREKSVVKFLGLLGLSKSGIRVDGCMVGLRNEWNKPVYKPWTLITNCDSLRSAFTQCKCDGSHEHGACTGKTAKLSESYTVDFVRRVHRAWESDVRLRHLAEGSAQGDIHDYIVGHMRGTHAMPAVAANVISSPCCPEFVAPAMPCCQRTLKHRERIAPRKYCWDQLAALMDGSPAYPLEDGRFMVYDADGEKFVAVDETTPLDLDGIHAMVARPVTKTEILQNEGANTSLLKEWAKLRNADEGRGTWDEEHPREFAEVAAEYRARTDGKKMHHGLIFEICVEKGSELPLGDPGRKYKGRVVFQGSYVRDEDNNLALFSDLSSAPATLAAAKAADAYGLMQGHTVELADAVSAYTQTTLKGDVDTWVRLPKSRWPDKWHQMGLKDPVCRLRLALYGHPDSGGYWEEHCNEKLTIAGFSPIPNWRSTYWHEELKLLLVVYVDDFKLAGPKESIPIAWDLISQHIELEQPTGPAKYLGCDHIVKEVPFSAISSLQAEADPDDESLLLTNKERNLIFGSMEGIKNPPTPKGIKPEDLIRPIRVMTYDMSGFFRQCVERYCELAKKKPGTLHKVCTPFIDEDTADKDVSLDEAGVLKDQASKVLMKILYGARMARYDLLRPVAALASQVSRWTKLDDKKLHRLVSYINCTIDLHMIGWVGDKFSDCFLRLYSDADFAGCKKSAKSTTGAFLRLSGPFSAFPLEGLSKKQGCVSVSTPEAETVAANAAVRSIGLPALDLWDKIMGKAVKMQFLEDNQAAIRILTTGKSPALRHLDRTHRVSLAWLWETFKDGHLDLIYINSEKEAADIFTKAFTDKDKWLHAIHLINHVLSTDLPVLTDAKPITCKIRPLPAIQGKWKAATQPATWFGKK